MVGPRRDCFVALLLVHQVDDFLADGTEVLSDCASADGLVIAVEGSVADEDGEDAEVHIGALDPNEIATDAVGLTEFFPMLPVRGLVLSG